MRRQILGASLAAIVGASMALAQESAPLGPQFQVNSYTPSDQSVPAVASDAAGNFVVVWHSTGSDGGDTEETSIQGRRYVAGGSTLGDQFQVNSYTTGAQSFPAVASDAVGNFVVVWHSAGSDGSDTDGSSIQGQRYDADGAPLGDQFQVNSYTTGAQQGAAVASDPEGDFVVAWISDGSYGTDSSASSVQGQRYAADGTALGGQFQVNTYTTSIQFYPALGSDADGHFVVVWPSYGSDGGDTHLFSVQGQRYDADGTPLGSQFQVNSYTTGTQVGAAVARDPQGDFVVAWTSYGSDRGDTDYGSIQGQRYDADGTPLGSQFQVNSYTTSYQFEPSIASDAAGNFVVAWTSFGSDGGDSSGYSIQGRRYDVGGIPLGEQFQVNSYTTSYQRAPAVASDPAGDFVVTWSSNGSTGDDSSGYGIQGQRYGDPTIFSDGFESGDTSVWSNTVP